MSAATCVLALLLVASCGDDAPQGSGTAVSVVVSFYPLEEAARRVGGALVRVANLTPPGAEPHDLELTSQDVLALRQAGLVIYMGRGFQPSVERAIRELPPGVALDVLAQFPTQSPSAGAAEQPLDPHVWLAPPLMKAIVSATTQALATKLPGSRAGIESRASAVNAHLDALHAEFDRGLRTCERRDIFTSHAAFGYLASQYRLTQVPITGVDPEAEPSSKQIQDVAGLARKRGATTILSESLVPPRVAETVARLAGAKTALLDPVEGISDADRAKGKDYFSVMRDNLRTLQSALGCRT